MVQAPRTRLEQYVQTAHLSVREFVGRFHAAAIECGEGKAHISERQAKRWLAGKSDLPRPVCCRVLEHWWAEPVSRLLGPANNGGVAVFTSEEALIVNADRERWSGIGGPRYQGGLRAGPVRAGTSPPRRETRCPGVLCDTSAGNAHRSCPPSRHRVRTARPHAQTAPTSRAVPACRTGVRPAVLSVLGPRAAGGR